MSRPGSSNRDQGENLIGGLSGLLGRLAELAEKGIELRRAVGESGGAVPFRTQDGREGRFQVGFNIRTVADAAGERVSVEPFGDVDGFVRGPADPAAETREPPVDVFDEPSHVLVVVEMPGIARDDATFTLEGDVLRVEARRGEGAGAKRYAKSIALPAAFPPGAMRIEANNGVFEVRLDRKDASAGSSAA